MPDATKIGKEPPKPTTKYTTKYTLGSNESNDRTAIIIGIIAIDLIAVIIATNVLLVRVKYETIGTYMMREKAFNLLLYQEHRHF